MAVGLLPWYCAELVAMQHSLPPPSPRPLRHKISHRLAMLTFPPTPLPPPPQDALMLDSEEEAAQLCTQHGFEVGVRDGVAVALLLKVSVSLLRMNLCADALLRVTIIPPLQTLLPVCPTAGGLRGPAAAGAAQAQRPHQQPRPRHPRPGRHHALPAAHVGRGGGGA